MIIKKVNSLQKFNHPSLQIVKEWEEIFATELGATLVFENRLFKNPVVSKIPCSYYLKTWRNPTFGFQMTASDESNYKNYANYIPCIIDYWLTERDEVRRFETQHKQNKAVLISSKEAYDFLKERNCVLNLAHLPLSLPDRYKLSNDTCYIKEYDFVLVGRQNPVLMEWLLEYEKTHNDLYYVFEGKEKYNYYTNRGEEVGYFKSREDYIRLIRKARLALYSTPGMDSSRVDAQNFNQVTPKFLEYVSACCHVIARYPHNSDTDYFELDSMSNKCESYKDFENCVDRLRGISVDRDKYSFYLSKHYTSVRVNQFKLLIEHL